MRAKSKNSLPVKKKQPAKVAAKRSKETLLKSAPTVPQAETREGGQRWFIAVLVFAAIVAGIALIASSNSFRSRVEVPPPAAPLSPPVQQAAPAPAPVAPVAANVRADAFDPQTTAAPDPEIDARRDYVLALATGSTEAIDLFLARHPDGFHADLARMQRRKFAERELPAVIRQLNVELKRVGCGPTGNAEWTAASQTALTAFNRYAQTSFDVKTPDASALKSVKEKNARVCPASAPAKAAEVPQQKRGLFFWE
jgi:hypothetical protein